MSGSKQKASSEGEVKRTPEESRLLKAGILADYAAEGKGKQGVIAERYGVTRAYVSFLICQQRRGVPDPGARKGPPNDEERAELVSALSRPPTESGLKEEEWTMSLAKLWYRTRFGRMIYLRDLEYIISQEGLKVVSPNRAYDGRYFQPGPGVAAKKRGPGRPRSDNFADEVARVQGLNLETLQNALRIDADTARALMSNAMVPLSAVPKRAPAAKAVLVKPGGKIGRNSSCPEGKPLKFKQCCGKRGLKECDGRGPK